MQPEQAEVARWLIKARHDWSAARKIFTPDCQELDTAAFHCQQAVEKLLKAFLVDHRMPFEKIHDLGRLLDVCVEIDPEFESIRDAVEPLTIFAVAFRYPGPADPTRADVQGALCVVEQVWAFLTTRLPRETVPEA